MLCSLAVSYLEESLERSQVALYDLFIVDRTTAMDQCVRLDVLPS
jgi:hypothetical protein